MRRLFLFFALLACSGCATLEVTVNVPADIGQKVHKHHTAKEKK